MKLNYKVQMILAIVIAVGFYVLTIISGQWIYRSIGLCISGLLYAIHPVVQENEASNKELKKAVRVAGIFLILIGLFTRP